MRVHDLWLSEQVDPVSSRQAAELPQGESESPMAQLWYALS